VDFETLLREDPDHVIEYLANRGTKLLGTFITEVHAAAVIPQPMSFNMDIVCMVGQLFSRRHGTSSA
jgi:hypothetical protein